MSAAADNYDWYYADKLWNLLPAVYRSEDTDQFGASGPLRELVNRIGAQAANIRRSIDRMWEDQSIETCDDWVIPYIGALLDTNLVPGLDPRGQRIDVARTIYYRQRKGTVGILEEIAANITGWDAKLVEFFRRMGRTRHLLDPPIGAAYHPSGNPGRRGDICSPPASAPVPNDLLAIAQGLSGALTHTGAGGIADLRNVYGALQAGTAFDEFSHTADIRAGVGRSGWYNVPHIGVFLWRLSSYAVGPVTPVASSACPGWYTFDPTGRDIPLFAASRTAQSYGDAWVSPVEAQLPTPISRALLAANATDPNPPVRLYSQEQGALAVYWRELSPLDDFLIDYCDLTIWPERGRFAPRASPPLQAMPVATYHYGFPSDIGAGPYDRRIDSVPIASPAPQTIVSGGGTALLAPGAIPASGTLVIDDSLTYQGAGDVSVDGELTVQAANEERPLIRFGGANAPWVLTGAPGSSLVLDGLFVSGTDVVLRGQFDSVTLSCCTLDPGNAATDPASAAQQGSPIAGVFAAAADGAPLVPSRLWIEGTVSTLTADRCVLSGIRTRNTGLVERVSVSNSTLQAIRTAGFGAFTADDIKDPAALEKRLLEATQAGSLDAIAAELFALAGSPPLSGFTTGSPPSAALLEFLNILIAGPSLYTVIYGAGVALSSLVEELNGTSLQSAASAQPASALSGVQDTPGLNRALLEDVFPLELADAALAFADGTVNLSRCTVLGRISAHALDASECILWDLALVDNTQSGCVRFSAWAEGSVLPRKYESVSIPQQAPLFTTIEFGQPAYGQLTALADGAIIQPAIPSGMPQNTISAGAADGAEMGAFARDKNPIKQRGLLLKFQEFMPVGLVPVIVYIT